jgi:hypothetical protein
MMLRTKRRIVWSVSVAAAAILFLAVVGRWIPCKRVDVWICPISGSIKTQVTWFGLVSRDERTASALEQWLKRKEPSFEPHWRHIATTIHYALGRSHICRPAPEICQLRPILDQVVSNFSDERLADLVTVLRQGSRDEQRTAIQRIAQDYFNRK